MPTMNPDTSDAVELDELLQFLNDWLTTDIARLGASLSDFVGSPEYDLLEPSARSNATLRVRPGEPDPANVLQPR